MMKRVEVLIIGGGFAGVSAAQALEKQGVRTLLVDRKDYFEVTFATLRNVAAPEVTKSDARKHYTSFLTGEFVQSGVATLGDQSAILENGDVIEFDTAIIATGTCYPTMPVAKSNTAFALETRNQEMATHHHALKAAKKVLVIGGGVVGVELAGEIAYAFPDKQTVLAHNSSQILDGFKTKTRRKSLEQLESLGVQVEFNTRYSQTGSSYIDENTGRESDADLVLQAVGTLPNSEFLKAKLGHILDSRGFVKVNEQLEVVEQKNMYALGDVADVGEPKLGYLAQQQGEYVAKTILNKRRNKKTKGYKRNPLMALIPTGQKTGVAELPFAVTTLKPLVNMKQKDLFISKVYKAFSG
ncbi:hypothetical protein BA953_17285 [Vibrio coralliilyticus]|uniref:NAD(P)/FAD-dependent oxidoreductase n=1 Tax=Vibrio coralliilyticus TaxID=190893 RepID=UPI000810791D|nr:FAD-dependent oxidoreductase [Vibrio coralliilyticus]ANW25941.1 hypothetical protein BA953_17285 [Vibrio coralliilyticus]